MTNTLISLLARLIVVAIVLGAFGGAGWLIYVVTQMCELACAVGKYGW